MTKAQELITEAIETLIPADTKYFDYVMGLLDMAAELEAITETEKAELTAAASNALCEKLRAEKN